MTDGFPQPEQLVARALRRAYSALAEHRLGSIRDVEPDVIDAWLPHAATTQGTRADLKGLLPRVLELFAAGRLDSTPEVLFGKLGQEEVFAWPVHERAAVDDVVTALWLATLMAHPARVGYPAGRLLTALAELGDPITAYLDDWSLLLEQRGRAGAAARRHREDLEHRAQRVRAQGGQLGDLFWSPHPGEAARLEAWLER